MTEQPVQQRKGGFGSFIMSLIPVAFAVGVLGFMILYWKHPIVLMCWIFIAAIGISYLLVGGR